MPRQDEKNIDNFILYNDALLWLEEKLENLFNKDLFDLFIAKSLIAYFEYKDKQYLYKSDVEICEKLMILNKDKTVDEQIFVGYIDDFFVDFIKLGIGTFLKYPISEVNKKVPVFVKNILYLFIDCYEEGEECHFDLLGVNIVTNNQLVSSYISNVIYRKYRLDTIKLSNFANSSAYLGSKKELVGFIVEAIWPHQDGSMPILDIMCGSGAVSNAFAQIGKVYASDAQRFCQLLAMVQGRGFNVRKAERLFNSLSRHYMKNMRLIQNECADALIEEEKIFHKDLRNRTDVVKSYSDFIHAFDIFSSTEQNSEFIERRIGERKQNHKGEPYCLFTYYFSNVYFGLEQCNQIDSIRYAIDQIADNLDRQWLLGILIVSVSAVASNYGSHFAQPKRIDETNVYDMIEKRKRSVWLEFSKRMLAIAAESERYPYEIVSLDGPWENALQEIKKRESNFIVYIDAPYKRDEYSRYYHVLETLVLYDYPSAERKGRLRSIKNGERFKSAFSSRNVKSIEKYFIDMITNIMMEARVCVWSYSDNSCANMVNIIDKIQNAVNCKVYIYSAIHRHVSQGKNSKKKKINATEYCIVFTKADNIIK